MRLVESAPHLGSVVRELELNRLRDLLERLQSENRQLRAEANRLGELAEHRSVLLRSRCFNAVGLLRPGQSRETTSMHPPRSCGFHDHQDQVDAFRGRIIVE
jgi:hypothetical protein